MSAKHEKRSHPKEPRRGVQGRRFRRRGQEYPRSDISSRPYPPSGSTHKERTLTVPFPSRSATETSNDLRRNEIYPAVATVFGLSEDKFRGPEKSAKAVLAKEVLILIGRERGAAVTELSLIAGLDTSNISRRHDATREKLQTDRKLVYARDQVEKIYLANIAESQT